MPKLKNRKGVAKRFKFTKTGKVSYTPCGKSHLATCKEEERKRRLRRKDTLKNKKYVKFLKKMLPYR